jgi:hypothetical protein
MPLRHEAIMRGSDSICNEQRRREIKTGHLQARYGAKTRLAQTGLVLSSQQEDADSKVLRLEFVGLARRSSSSAVWSGP